MSAWLIFVGDWGHALTAVLFAALGIFLLRRRDETPEPRLIAAALLMTSCWALYISFGSVSKPLSGIAEGARNAAWLLALFVLSRRGPAGRIGFSGGIAAIYAVAASLLVIETLVDLSWPYLSADSELHRALSSSSIVLRMMIAIASLLLLHHLHMVSPSREGGGVTLLLGALAAMWAYDLGLYAMAYAAPAKGDELYALRGPLMAMLPPIMAVGLRKGMSGRVQLSRFVAFQSISVAALTLYVLVLIAAAVVIQMIAGPYARMIEVAAVFVMAVTAILFLPAPTLRAFWKVQVAKHFFQHRYDYRAEWMRFGETIGRPGEDGSPLGERVAKAVADITDSPAAILFLRNADGGLSFEAHWKWPDGAQLDDINFVTARYLEQSGRILDLWRLSEDDRQVDLPSWAVEDARRWALVPLIHYGHLVGAIHIARPPIDRRLDWEDFDMLRAAGQQAATYISEAQGQQALSDAQRFDEFNRRFAFIIHDVKNLVSQLSLLSRNAERHADNPAFRADMVLTLKESVGKLNDMLARLTQHSKGRAEEPDAVPLRALLDDIARSRARQHSIHVSGEADSVLGDRGRIEQIVTHLLQNAIDASAAGEHVELHLRQEDDAAIVEVIDRGVGMSADYIRRELFKPFASSKPGGFGLGAFEARSLAQAMGGSLSVESRPGMGSRFTLRLPLARSVTTANETRERAA